MRVQVEHRLGREGARRRLEGFADGLAARAWPGDVDVKDIRKTWTGDRLDFSFIASRGFFTLPMRGWLDVADAEVVLDAEMPQMLSMLVGEAKIRETLTGELGRVLAQP